MTAATLRAAPAAPDAESDVRVTVARTMPEARALVAAWRTLQGSNVITDPDYYFRVLEVSPRVRHPYLVLVERDGRPELMIVGRVEDLELPCRLGYKTVYEPVLRTLTVVYGGFLGDAVEESAELLLGELRAALDRGEADLLHLPHLRVGSRLYEVARTRPSWLCRSHATDEKPHWRLHLAGSHDEFVSSLSARTREGVRRAARRLEREYGSELEVAVFDDRASLERLLADVEEVAAKTYQRGLGKGLGAGDLQRSVTETWIDRGWFRAWVLYLRGRPVAFWHGLAYRDTFRTGIAGYDPALAKLNVGTYLLMRTIADLCADPAIRIVDYGYGDAEYKRRFGDESWVEDDVVVYAGRLRPVFVNLLRSSLLHVNAFAKRLARRAGVYGRVKRAWRRRLSSTAAADGDAAS